MLGYIVILSVGILIGLVFGPSTERLEAARLEGYLDGLNPKIVPPPVTEETKFRQV